jgi:hypothetical protein
MARKDPNRVAEKWASRLAGATEDIRSGVETTTVNPAAEAVKKKEKFKRRLIEAIDGGKWDGALSKVTLDQWKSAMVEKGITRIPSGASAARSKMADFMNKLLSYQESLKAKIAAMPDLTLEDRINRMTTWIREMSKFKK